MKFSIGIPAYKSKFLKECIASVLEQSYKDFELIIVNDASPEDIDSVVKSFDDKRIRYFVNDQNFGAENVVDNWNKCLSYAKGEFFILMGDDDLMDPQYLAEFSMLIQSNPDYDIFHCRSCIIDDTSHPILITQALPRVESVYDSIWHRINEWRMQYVSDFVYRTQVLVSNGGFYKLQLAWASDDISSYMAMGSKGIVHTNKPLFQYRRSKITISTSGSAFLKLAAIQGEERWYKWFLENVVPQSQSDEFLKTCIMRDLPKYFKRKIINTISYHGYDTKQSILHNFFLWYKSRKSYNLSIKEVVYTLILAVKKREVDKFYG